MNAETTVTKKTKGQLIKELFGVSRTQYTNMRKLGIDPRTNLVEGLEALKAKRKAEKRKMRKEQMRKRDAAQVYFRNNGKKRISKHKKRVKGGGGKVTGGGTVVKKEVRRK